MKRFISCIITAVSVFMCCANICAAEGIIRGNYTYITVRGVFDELGFTVDWDNETQTATIYDDDHTISASRWDHNFMIDSSHVSGSARHIIEDGKMYLPLREIAEHIDAEVSWDAETKTAHITYNGKDVYINCYKYDPTAQQQTPSIQFNKGKYYPGTNIPDMGAFYGIPEGSIYAYKANNQVVYTYSARSLKGGTIHPYWVYLEELGFKRNAAAENYLNSPRLSSLVFEKDNWYILIEYDGSNYYVKFAPGIIVLPGQQ